MIAGKAALTPAKLEDGYYPIEHFREIIIAADIIPYGEEAIPKISRRLYEYIGAGKE